MWAFGRSFASRAVWLKEWAWLLVFHKAIHSSFICFILCYYFSYLFNFTFSCLTLIFIPVMCYESVYDQWKEALVCAWMHWLAGMCTVVILLWYSPVVVFEFSYRAFTQLTSTLQFIVKRLLCTYLNNFCSVLTVLNTDWYIDQ